MKFFQKFKVGYIQTCTRLESMWHPKGGHHSVFFTHEWTSSIMDENIYNDEKLHIMNENICSHMTCIHDYVDNDGENVICESSWMFYNI